MWLALKKSRFLLCGFRPIVKLDLQIPFLEQPFRYIATITVGLAPTFQFAAGSASANGIARPQLGFPRRWRIKVPEMLTQRNDTPFSGGSAGHSRGHERYRDHFNNYHLCSTMVTVNEDQVLRGTAREARRPLPRSFRRPGHLILD